MCYFEKFNEIFPSKKEFYSSLSGKVTSNKDYQYVLNVWVKFEMKTTKEYQNC